ncbi:MAG: hypothetical protein WCP21_00730 [Armatimonadota bacterium]
MTRLMGIAVLALCVSGVQGAQICSATHIECRDGKARLARHWDTAFTEDFEQGLGAWQTENYESNLKLEVSPDQPHGGSKAFRVSWVKDTDTAWELKSPPLKVSGGNPFELHLWLRNSRGLTTTSPHQGHYESRVEWQDDDGKVVGQTPITYGDANEAWHEIVLAGDTPAGATQAVLRFGFDQPNLAGEDFLALDDLRLLQRTEQSGYETSGEFLSRPFRAPVFPGAWKVKWQAEVPPGTKLAVDVRAGTNGGWGPGVWLDFVPAVNGTERVLERNLAWLQYRVRMTTQDRLRSPALSNLSLASDEDNRFDGVDTTSPVVERFSPSRTADASAAIEFDVDDEGVGPDPRTVAVWLDGVRMPWPPYGKDGLYHVWHPEPLHPPQVTTSFETWRTRNYQSALSLKPDAPRTPEAPPSLLVTRAAGEVDTAFTIASPQIPVAAGEQYTLSFWLRTDVPVDGVDPRGSGLQWLDDSGKSIGEAVRISYGVKSAEWHEVRQEFTAPTGAEWATVTFGWDNPNLSNRQFVQFAEPQLLGPHPKRPSTAPNLHQVTIAATDYAGNAMLQTRYVLIKEPPTSGIVTIRDDGVTLIDGKPFFPIGIYSVSKLPVNDNNFDKAFAELKAAGFNTAHTYNTTRNTDFAEFYAAARKYGLKVFVAPESGSNNPDANSALATVARECNESPLLAWYLADDTAGWIGPAELMRVHEAIMQVDPYHMTTQADGITLLSDDRYTKYVDSTTGFLPEIYPIHEKTGNHVADVIRGMKNVQAAWAKAGRVTPVWAIIQDFEGWGWQRYPTEEEERCMVYLALIHGAQGMTWYTYSYRPPDKHGAAYDPKVWAYLKGLTGELSSLSEALTARAPREQPVGEIVSGPRQGDLDYPSLNLRLLQWQGKWTLLAANSSAQAITARVTLPGLKQEAEVLFEGRKVTTTGGRLQDTFAPLAVHVYRW